MITFDAVAVNPLNPIGGVQDFTHVVGTSRGKELLAFLYYSDNLSLVQQTSGITYNGASMTLLSHATSVDISGNTVHSEVWYLINPSSGSNTLEVTFGGSFTSGRPAAIASVSYLVTDQNAPLNFRNTQTNPTDGIDTATTTKNNGWVLTFFGSLSATPTYTAVTGTIRTQGTLGAYVDQGPCSPAGTFTNEITPSVNTNIVEIGCTIYPSTFIPQASFS